jgi:RND family efflux transporter MFP subunit
MVRLSGGGRGGVRAKLGFATLAALAFVAGCKKKAAQAPPPPLVRVVQAQSREVETMNEWLATLDGSVNADIRPRVAGTVEAVVYQEGSQVTAGTLMFRLDRRPFVAALANARGNYANAVAQWNKARADVARYTPLVAEHAISRQELENARAAQAAGAATTEAMRGALAVARLNVQWTEVRSPIDGLAGIAQTRVGNLVSSSTTLATVSTLDPVRASINISEREYLRWAEILNHANDPRWADRRSLEIILSDGSVHPYRARRVIVDRRIEPSTGTLLVQTLFPNPDNILRPGMFAKLRAHGEQRPAILIPEVAVQELQGQYRVTIVDDQQRLQVRRVELGRLVGHDYVVERGLAPGDRVVIAGAQGPPGTKVRVEDARAERRPTAALPAPASP